MGPRILRRELRGHGGQAEGERVLAVFGQRLGAQKHDVGHVEEVSDAELRHPLGQLFEQGQRGLIVVAAHRVGGREPVGVHDADAAEQSAPAVDGLDDDQRLRGLLRRRFGGRLQQRQREQDRGYRLALAVRRSFTAPSIPSSVSGNMGNTCSTMRQLGAFHHRFGSGLSHTEFG